VRFGLGLPGGLSFLVHGSFHEPITGLDAFEPADIPPVGLTFQTYHLMVALGLVFILLTAAAWLLLRRGTLFSNRPLLWVFVFAVGAAYLANQLGWVSAEIGRQPWIVYGLLRTQDALSESVSGGAVLSSIFLFGVIYLLLFAVWLFVLNDKIQHGPRAVPVVHEPGGGASLSDIVKKRSGRTA
jgi:cytochrome d ubiquinol oxidase subunit I